MRTVFRECFLVNFGVRPAALQPLIPPPLELDLHAGEAFLSVVIADMVRMRPAFLPPICGVSYTQVVYRVVVRHRDERGVYFVRSDANHRLMALLGDWFTFFRFHFARASWERSGGAVGFELRNTVGGAADIRARFLVDGATTSLPAASAFSSLDHARGFLVELFAAFGVPGPNIVKTVRIERGVWGVRVVRDAIADYRLLMDAGGPFGAGAARLDSVFYVTDVPYLWFSLGSGGADPRL